MKRSKANRLYVRQERLVRRERTKPFDLRTLEAVHDYMEFKAEDETELDAWLHAQIIKARGGPWS